MTPDFWFGAAWCAFFITLAYAFWLLFGVWERHRADHRSVRNFHLRYAPRGEVGVLDHRFWELNERVCKLEDAQGCKPGPKPQEYKLKKADQ